MTKEVPQPIIIEKEEEWEVESILNQRKIQGKDKYLVRWKGFMVEGDTWEGRENLENTQELVEEFKKEYGKDDRKVRRQEKEKGNKDYQRGEFPGKCAAKKLYEQNDKRYDRKYWERLERNWRKQKRTRLLRQRKIRKEREKKEYQEKKIKEQDKEDKMGGMANPMYEL